MRISDWSSDLCSSYLLLHPFMPFVTEELWEKLYGAPGGYLMLRDWPNDGARAEDKDAAEEIGWLVRLIAGVRAARSALHVPAAAKIAMIANGGNAETIERLSRERKSTSTNSSNSCASR